MHCLPCFLKQMVFYPTGPASPKSLIRTEKKVFDLRVQTASCPKKANTGSVGFEAFTWW